MLVTKSEHKEVIEQILDRASHNLEFRQQLLVDPREVIYQELGVRIPASYRLKFVEKERGFDAMVVLPDFQDPSGELSEDDLEAVAGGDGGNDPTTW